MDKIKINIKPLSVNRAWQGRRYKTSEYKAWEQEMLYRLPPTECCSGSIRLEIVVGVSNIRSDIDNVLKPFLDVLQKKYGFDDNQIFELEIRKEKVKKGKEFIEFLVKPLKNV